MLSDRGDTNVGATRASPVGLPARKQVRLPWHIYVQYGYYFVTVCVEQRKQFLGTISNGESQLSQLGGIVSQTLLTVTAHHRAWGLDCFVIMPNHWHAVLYRVRQQDTAVNQVGPERGSLSAVVGSLKSATTRLARETGLWDDKTLMQRGFYEHVIRSESSLHHIREYILNNPASWDLDYLNPLRRQDDPFDLWIRREDNLPISLWFSGDARVAPTQGETE